MKEPLQATIYRIAVHDDASAFRDLYNFYFQDIYAFVLGYVKQKEMAEEVVSDVFVKIWEARGRLQEIRFFKTYLFKAAYNQSMTCLEKEKNKKGHQFPLNESTGQYLHVSEETPESHLIGEELHSKLQEVIMALPDGCRTAFLLVKDQGMKYQEAAQVLGISVHTVENQVLKAMRIIKPLFGPDLKAKLKQAGQKAVRVAQYAALLWAGAKLLSDFFAWA